MKIETILKTINRHTAIYLCLVLFFAFCWFIHYLARQTIEICNRNAEWREWAMTNGRMVKATALIDWVAAHSSLAVAYAVLIVTVVAFSQSRRHPVWTFRLTALILCIPFVVYWWPCGCVVLNLLQL